MPPGTLEDTVAEFRRALAGRDEEARRAMTRAYRPMLARLQAEADDLLAQLERRRARLKPGERVPISWLYERDRALALRRQVEGEVRRWSREVEPAVRKARDAAATFGPAHAERLIAERALTADEFQRLGRTLAPFRSAEVERIVASVQAGSPLRDLLDDLGPGAAGGVEAALVEGVALGRGAVEIGQAIGKALDGNLARGHLIARTETMRTYRETSRQAYLARSELLRGWRWWSSLDRRTCVSCWAMHGSLHRLDERLDDHPNGRCTMIPELDEAATGIRNTPIPRGPREFMRLDEATQRAVLGPSKFAAYRSGRVTLADLTEQVEHPRWGSMRRVSSLERAEVRRQAILDGATQRLKAAAPPAPTSAALPGDRAARIAARREDPRYLKRLRKLERDHDATGREIAEATAGVERHRARMLEIDADPSTVSGPASDAWSAEYLARQRLEDRLTSLRANLHEQTDGLEGFRRLPEIHEEFPALEELGERLVVTSSLDSLPTNAALRDLARVDPRQLREVAKAGYTIRLDTSRTGVGGFPGWDELKGKAVRGGDDVRKWSEVGGGHAGAQSTGRHRLSIYVAGNARAGTMLHEFGHALAHVRRLDGPGKATNRAVRLARAHIADYRTIEERGWYYARGAGSDIGVSETLAEGFADMHRLGSPEELDRVWGPRMAAELRAAFDPAGVRKATR